MNINKPFSARFMDLMNLYDREHTLTRRQDQLYEELLNAVTSDALSALHAQ